MTGHVPETAGHDAEITGHALPKYPAYSVCKDFSSVSRLRSSPEPASAELTEAKGVVSNHSPDLAAVYDPSQGTGCVFANGLVAQ
jgi:hypothetical protein